MLFSDLLSIRSDLLSLSLRSAIMVLFKNIGVDMKEVKPTSLLKDRVREVEGNLDFSNKDIGASQPQLVTEINTGIMCTLNQYTRNLHFVSGPLMEDENMATLSLSDQLPSGQRLSLIPHHILLVSWYNRIVPLAMERAIKEVMAPVVQRSVTIAIQTTKELVLKDYAMESDETQIYNAAHLMVASLAGSLAHVTCKEHWPACSLKQALADE
ncbi:CCR4-NOT transcription complex subunit 1 [Camellia lanceoleosa]|uniref:CCR4-NOT transcription complex subunit 1 n=1 Tax=Camellia lanceoleosa TaxID=1840588 RepID=A0ACC0J6U0_9ERIC|nr:CCR4-NOT transcription complex subunit 1 [Camellia lanceoleosa]